MSMQVATLPIGGSLAHVAGGHVKSSGVPSSGAVCSRSNASRLVAVRAAKEDKSLVGVVFDPFKEVQSQSLQLPKSPHESLARQRFHSDCEGAINNQINVEYNVSYVYHALFAYFDRDNVALRGFAKFFKESSEEEREHAEKLMTYQNKRGGRVQLQSILLPPTDFSNAEKGDALYAMELSLSLEKLTMEKLYTLHKVAEDAHDVQLTDYVESEFLSEQIEAIKKVSEYVAQLRRIGNDGHGIYHFDRVLGEK